MSNAHDILREFSGAKYDYGNLEERITFISDHYYEAMQIYRLIVTQQKEHEKKRKEAHQTLQKLRADEERWKRQKRKMSEEEKAEHAARKEHYVNLRQAEFVVMHKRKPLTNDKLVNFVVTHMRLFKILDKMDRGGRKKLGPLSRKVLEKALWPLRKMTEVTINTTDSKKAKSTLRKHLKTIKAFPKKLEKNIVSP